MQGKQHPQPHLSNKELAQVIESHKEVKKVENKFSYA